MPRQLTNIAMPFYLYFFYILFPSYSESFLDAWWSDPGKLCESGELWAMFIRLLPPARSVNHLTNFCFHIIFQGLMMVHSLHSIESILSLFYAMPIASLGHGSGGLGVAPPPRTFILSVAREREEAQSCSAVQSSLHWKKWIWTLLLSLSYWLFIMSTSLFIIHFTKEIVFWHNRVKGSSVR